MATRLPQWPPRKMFLLQAAAGSWLGADARARRPARWEHARKQAPLDVSLVHSLATAPSPGFRYCYSMQMLFC